MSWSGLFWWRPPCLLRVVLVSLVSDPDLALRGVLWRSRGAWLVLKDGELVKPHGEPTKVDGELVIHRSNVAFLQVLAYGDRQ